MAAEQAHYNAYMLRMWQDQGEAGTVWRALLESPHTGERHGFTSLEDLFDFLRQHIESSNHSAQPLARAVSEGNK